MILTSEIFNYGKKFLKYSQTSFSGIINFREDFIQSSSVVPRSLQKEILVILGKFSPKIRCTPD